MLIKIDDDFIFINLLIDYNTRLAITVMSVISQCIYSALIILRYSWH